MNRHALFPIFIAISFCGCKVKTDAPDLRAVTNAPASSATKADTTTATDNRENPSGSLSDASHGRDQHVSFPAAGVKLLRPEGFDDAENFHGFQQPNSQSSVMVTMIPQPFSEVIHGFTVEQMKTRGMTLRSKENIQVDGKSGALLNVTQTAYGTEFAKWIVVFGDDQETVMATATFPRAYESELSARLKFVVLSAKLDHTAPPTPGADVGFTIVASEKLKLTRGIGKMLVYTKDGVIPAKSPEDPLFIAAPSLSKVPTKDQRRFAVERLFQTAHTRVSSLSSNKAISIDGLDGYEILADAEDSDSGTPLVLFQVILFDEGSYVLIQGLVGRRLRAEHLSEFKAMAHSLKKK